MMPWAPVCFGLGIALYFALPMEPGPWAYALIASSAVLAGLIGRFRRERLGPVMTALVILVLGLLAAGLRTATVAGPVLDFRYYGPIEGRLVGVDRSASDVLRLTLDRVVLTDTDPARVPHRVRVSLHGNQPVFRPVAGARVALTGHLSPPSGPGEPGGFDFQRHAWFLGIGAVGYTRNPAVLMTPRRAGDLPLLHLRMSIAEAVRARMAGEPGAFAAAVMTGDRSAISIDTLDDLRRSNIAHLLAISGLHMGLLTGFIFFSLRAGLALIPALALRVPTKKIAAIGALLAGAAYLSVAGGNVATERAFIQVAVMFCAVLIDRRAITLRSVAIAALIVMARRPETMLGPGFQMSFAATTALVAVFNWVNRIDWLMAWPRWTRGITGLVISSAVAGAATAPFAAAHFNMMAVWGLPANLLTVPVMGSVVVPAAVVAGLLWPLGLEAIPLAAMEAGLAWILRVAAWLSDGEGAIRTIVMPPGAVLGLITLGALTVILWQGRGRWIGVLPVLAALLIWVGSERAEVLISDTGRLVGVTGPDGRVLSRARGEGFVARLWLENDGDRADQRMAAARAGWRPDGAGQVITLGHATLWHGVGRRAGGDLSRACAAHDWVVTSEPVPRGLGGPMPVPFAAGAALASGGASCTVFGPERLRQTGALAIDGSGRLIATARQLQGNRPWVPDP